MFHIALLRRQAKEKLLLSTKQFGPQGLSFMLNYFTTQAPAHQVLSLYELSTGGCLRLVYSDEEQALSASYLGQAISLGAGDTGKWRAEFVEPIMMDAAKRGEWARWIVRINRYGHITEYLKTPEPPRPKFVLPCHF